MIQFEKGIRSILPRFQKLLSEFKLEQLFNELGWDKPTLKPQSVSANGEAFTLSQVAHKRGVAVFRCSPDATGKIPPGAFSDPHKLDGRVLRASVLHGEPLTESGLQPLALSAVRLHPGDLVAPAAARG